jgi:hypothetical protein
LRACGCDSICAYVLPYHRIFLHTHLGKSGKCRLKLTQTATTSSMSCRWHGPIWPKLEQHVMSWCRDMSATFPAKSATPQCTGCESPPYLDKDSQAPLGTIRPILVTSRGGEVDCSLNKIQHKVEVTRFTHRVGDLRSSAHKKSWSIVFL